MHLQIFVVDVQRKREAFALNRARERGSDVEIQSIAKFVGLRSATGLDAGGEIARIVTSEAGFSERTKQIAQRAIAEKVEALVGDLKLGLCLILSHLAAHTRLLRRIVWRVDGN